MTAPRTATATLLQDLYQIAHMQAELDKQNLSAKIDWAKLRLRLNDALVGEGIELPKLPEWSQGQGADRET